MALDLYVLLKPPCAMCSIAYSGIEAVSLNHLFLFFKYKSDITESLISYDRQLTE